ncbi:hypothetical protein [Streptomyces sp. NPDC101393]|uniref:hypothetical protein n=1 Tax=Streptomyces sp. NPDC101393 TaxID=3366141 RepID=UPI00380E0109
MHSDQAFCEHPLGCSRRGVVPAPEAAGALLTPDRYAGIEVHAWQFGGRES